MAGETEQLGEFKSQPWIVYDTVAAYSFLLGEDRQGLNAINTSGPAINARGEMLFFSSTGRTKAQCPWYTNLELVGQLAYGFEAWQVYCHFGFPPWPADADLTDDAPSDVGNQSPPSLLAQILIQFSVLELTLGQEPQMQFPLHKFGSGGGLYLSGASGGVVPQNSLPQAGNVLKLPEPIEFPRTQNVDAKIRIAPEVHAVIGSPASPGVGCAIADQKVLIGKDQNEVPPLPYTVQVGLIGRRVKKTQYGQTPASAG
jgi:hypothetical protein